MAAMFRDRPGDVTYPLCVGVGPHSSPTTGNLMPADIGRPGRRDAHRPVGHSFATAEPVRPTGLWLIWDEDGFGPRTHGADLAFSPRPRHRKFETPHNLSQGGAVSIPTSRGPRATK